MTKLTNIDIKKLTQEQASTELARLAKLIKHYDYLYYQLDNPEVSDAKYDELIQRNKAIELQFPHLQRADSPSLRVGAPPAHGFRKVKHRRPMLSLDNAFSIDDVSDFLDKTRRFLNMPEGTEIELVAEPKIDGLSAALHYQDGKFILGATRGDGQEGEDITENLRTVSGVPATITVDDVPANFEVRGEVYISKSDFAQLNKARAESGETLFANPRNAAAGSLRQLDPEITRQRPLKFFAYYVEVAQHNLATTHSKSMEILRRWGFTTTPDTVVCKTLQQVDNNYAKLVQKRAELDFDIDGIVYKVNDLTLQSRLGAVGRSPRYAIAHKFPAERAQTRLEKINIQVGRTGVLTPVAHLAPVTVGGVVVSRATLHNSDEIDRLGVGEGDLVEIQRAGDVIPQVIKVIESKHNRSYIFPNKCPSCGSEVVQIEDEVAKRCIAGLSCPAQAIERLKHFVSRDAFDIEGLGSRIVEAFYKEGLIKSPVDIFTLAQRDAESAKPLKRQDGWGVQSAKNLFSAIEQRRKIELHRFIYALGIPQIGQINAKLLAKNYRSIQNLQAQMQQAENENSEAWQELMAIDGIGESVAQDIVQFFNLPESTSLLDDLFNKAAVTVLDDTSAQSTAGPMANKSIVFTGTLEEMSRNEAKAIAERLGAKVVGSVSKKTNVVVVGRDAGSKAKRAKELGLDILDEAAWLELARKYQAAAKK